MTNENYNLEIENR